MPEVANMKPVLREIIICIGNIDCARISDVLILVVPGVSCCGEHNALVSDKHTNGLRARWDFDLIVLYTDSKSFPTY